jgi:hypothetical protein
MKIIFTLVLILALLSDVFQNYTGYQQVVFVKASLDSRLMYIIITASLMGIVKLKKMPGNQ